MLNTLDKYAHEVLIFVLPSKAFTIRSQFTYTKHLSLGSAWIVTLFRQQNQPCTLPTYACVSLTHRLPYDASIHSLIPLLPLPCHAILLILLLSCLTTCLYHKQNSYTKYQNCVMAWEMPQTTWKHWKFYRISTL